jgi:hypothetical protein
VENWRGLQMVFRMLAVMGNVRLVALPQAKQQS